MYVLNECRMRYSALRSSKSARYKTIAHAHTHTHICARRERTCYARLALVCQKVYIYIQITITGSKTHICIYMPLALN